MPMVPTSVIVQGVKQIGLGALGGAIGSLFGLGQEGQVSSPGGAPVLTLNGGAANGGAPSAAQACAVPFQAQRCGTGIRAVAQVHALVNPQSGKLQWFGPGRIRFIPNKTARRRRPR